MAIAMNFHFTTKMFQYCRGFFAKEVENHPEVGSSKIFFCKLVMLQQPLVLRPNDSRTQYKIAEPTPQSIRLQSEDGSSPKPECSNSM